MADSQDIFIEVVKRELARRQWDAQDLAKRAGMKPAQLSKYMRKVNSPTLKVVSRVAEALGMGAGELLMPQGSLVPRSEPMKLQELFDMIRKALRAWPEFRQAVKAEIQDIEHQDPQT